jgi:hypothetical protein
LSGIWQAVGSAHWNIEPHAAYSGPLWQLGVIGAAAAGTGIVEGGNIPYQPWAVTKRSRGLLSGMISGGCWFQVPSGPQLDF